MRPIEITERSVQRVVLGNVDPQRPVAVGVPGDANRLGERVIRADLEPVGKAPFEPRLQRIVLAVADGRDETRLTGAPELLIQLAAGLAAADWRPIQFSEAELIDLSRRHVRRFAHQAPAQLLLKRHVPRPDLAAVEVVGQGEDRNRARDGNDSVPQIGVGNHRNAVCRPADEGQ